MNDINLGTVYADPNFQKLAPEAKSKVFETVSQRDQNYLRLPDDAKNSVRQKFGLQAPTSSGGSPLKAGAKAAAEEVAPAAGGIAGGVVGAEIGGELGATVGSIAGPVGAVVGGAVGAIGGGIAGGMGGSAIIQKGQQMIGNLFSETREKIGFSPEQRDQEEQQHPIATAIGSGAVDLASMAVPTKLVSRWGNEWLSNKIWQEASPVQKKSLLVAEDKGLKVRPVQAQPGEGQKVIGTPENQKIMNRWSAAKTGYVAKEGEKVHLDREFIKGRKDALGDEYTRIYSDPKLGGKITLGEESMQSLVDILNKEPPSSGFAVKKVKKLEPPSVGGATLKTWNVKGDDFKVAMSELKQAAWNSPDPNIRHELTIVLNDINNSMATHNPSVAKELTVLNPKYRSALTLNDAFERRIIDVNGNIDGHDFGRMLAKDSRNATNPLYEVGETGESLNIGRMGNNRFKGQSAPEVSIPGVGGKVVGAIKSAPGMLPGVKEARGAGFKRNPIKNGKETTSARGVAEAVGARGGNVKNAKDRLKELGIDTGE